MARIPLKLTKGGGLPQQLPKAACNSFAISVTFDFYNITSQEIICPAAEKKKPFAGQNIFPCYFTSYWRRF